MIGRKLLPSILLSVALFETAVGGGAPAQLLESGLPVLSPCDSLCGLSMTCFIQGLSLLAPQDASGPSFKAHMTFFFFFFTHGFFNVGS